jgi:hypothetical protein
MFKELQAWWRQGVTLTVEMIEMEMGYDLAGCCFIVGERVRVLHH